MQTEFLRLSGMSCGSGDGKVTRTLQAVDGVKDVDVPLAAGQVIVQFDEQRASKDQMKTAIERAGYAVVRGAAPKRGGGCCCG